MKPAVSGSQLGLRLTAPLDVKGAASLNWHSAPLAARMDEARADGDRRRAPGVDSSMISPLSMPWG
jgi:hypothetical protein